MSAIDTPVLATQTLAWDKTFPRSERVYHRKVTFCNRLGVALVASTPTVEHWSQRNCSSCRALATWTCTTV
jgi:hypothetical protein